LQAFERELRAFDVGLMAKRGRDSLVRDVRALHGKRERDRQERSQNQHACNACGRQTVIHVSPVGAAIGASEPDSRHASARSWNL